MAILEYSGSKKAGVRRDGVALADVVRGIDWILLLSVAGVVAIWIATLLAVRRERARAS